MSTKLVQLRQKIVDVRPNELRALGLAFVFNFLVLASYYVVRPIRDDIGAAGGVEKLPWMYTGTLIAMLIANALFSSIVARMSRRRFIPIAYRFFIVNLVLFYLLMKTGSTGQQVWIGRAFFVWVSVFNLFVVTVFWAFMTDVFNSDQGKRLFGFISVGGTLGGIIGGLITASLVRKIGSLNLLFITAAMLELAAQCVRIFPAGFRQHHPGGHPERSEGPRELESVGQKERSLAFARDGNSKEAEQPIGGNLWSGITHALRSPYLLGICAFMLFHSITSTLVYFQQADITGHHFQDRAARTAFFAQVDLTVNVLTIMVQIFLTGRLLKWVGVGVTLAFLPVISVIGFLAMGFAPGLALLASFQILRRAGNFAVTRPAREVLFTVLRREDKYKAKSFIDTFVYRAGDQIGAWSYPLLTWLGLGLTGISFVAAPLAAVWCALSLWLGKKQQTMAREREQEPQLQAA
jgi:ATP:ADP antiporter, AAA family